MATKHHAKRLREGLYLYRGFKIHRIKNEGFVDHRYHYVWEAEDHDGCGFAHSDSFRKTKILIDEDIDAGLVVPAETKEVQS